MPSIWLCSVPGISAQLQQNYVLPRFLARFSTLFTRILLPSLIVEGHVRASYGRAPIWRQAMDFRITAHLHQSGILKRLTRAEEVQTRMVVQGTRRGAS